MEKPPRHPQRPRPPRRAGRTHVSGPPPPLATGSRPREPVANGSSHEGQGRYLRSGPAPRQVRDDRNQEGPRHPRDERQSRDDKRPWDERRAGDTRSPREERSQVGPQRGGDDRRPRDERNQGGPRHPRDERRPRTLDAPAGRDLIFGIEPVRELIGAAPGAIRVLYVKEGSEARFAAEIDGARTQGANVIRVSDDELTRMAGSEARHHGLVAIMREYQYAAFEDVVAEAHDPLLVIDGVTDPRNLGAIMRSAECAGVRAI